MFRPPPNRRARAITLGWDVEPVALLRQHNELALPDIDDGLLVVDDRNALVGLDVDRAGAENPAAGIGWPTWLRSDGVNAIRARTGPGTAKSPACRKFSAISVSQP
jgi:hypothetical protein